MSTTLSIVIPSYDRPLKLERALNSCLRQSQAPDEILVMDNGQNPQTAAKVADARSRCGDYPIRHIPSPPFDLRAALSLGIKTASGEWTILLDDDDFILPDRIEQDRKLAAASAPEDIVIVHDFARIDYHSELVWLHRMQHKQLGLKQALCLDEFPPPPAATWRSETLKAFHSFDLPDGWMTDFELYASLLPHGSLCKSGRIGYVMDDTRVEGRLTTSVDKYMQMIELHRERFRETRKFAGVEDAAIDQRLDAQKAFFAAKNLGLAALFSAETPACRKYLKESLKGLAAPLRAMASRWLSPMLPEMRGSRSYKLDALSQSNPGLCRCIKASKL